MAESFVSTKRLYVDGPLDNDNSKVVPEGHPDVAYLLVPAGGMVSAEHAERFGLKAPSAAAQAHARLLAAGPGSLEWQSLSPEDREKLAEEAQEQMGEDQDLPDFETAAYPSMERKAIRPSKSEVEDKMLSEPRPASLADSGSAPAGTKTPNPPGPPAKD